MANIGQQMQKGLLDYMNLGFTSNRPAAWAVALGTGVPGTLVAVGLPGEMSSGLGYSRQTLNWGVAAGTPSTATNVNALTFGPFSSIQTVTGVGVIDTIHAQQTPGIGNGLWLGTLATPRIVQVGDSLILAAGALTAQVN